jgi:hypothetical protein
MQKSTDESPRLATELDRLERDIKISRAAVSAGQEPVQLRLEHPYRIEERHRALLQSYARAVLRERLEGKTPEPATWVSDEREPLCIRRLAVVKALQQVLATWESGVLLPPVSDAAKIGDVIVDALT